MDKIYVAKIGKTVGLNGLQKLHIDSDFPEQFKKDSTFITDKNQQLTIESYNSKNNTVKFIGINSQDSAKKLTNRTLFVSADKTRDICNLDDKQFFWFDIIGCEVIENSELLGTINDIQRMPLSDYLQIKTTKELQQQKYANIFLLPYIDEYIISVDIENKKVFTKNSKEILKAS